MLDDVISLGHIRVTLTSMFCPMCGNQTVYRYEHQSVHYVCGCGYSFQLRTNERGKDVDRRVSELIQERIAE